VFANTKAQIAGTEQVKGRCYINISHHFYARNGGICSLVFTYSLNKFAGAHIVQNRVHICFENGEQQQPELLIIITVECRSRNRNHHR